MEQATAGPDTIFDCEDELFPGTCITAFHLLGIIAVSYIFLLLVLLLILDAVIDPASSAERERRLEASLDATAAFSADEAITEVAEVTEVTLQSETCSQAASSVEMDITDSQL